MAKNKTRLKTPAAAVSVPQNPEEANDAIRTIGIAQRDLIRIETAMNDELARIKERFEAEAAPLKAHIEITTNALQVWSEANRATLTREGKVKTAQLPAGELGWRTRPPSCTVRGADAVLATLKRLGLSRFIRIKEEINKEACLNEAEIAKAVPGISIAQGEDFFVQPFEAELSEAA